VHLLVSELLGSFGDNELSPECLACALPLLLPGLGLCIPASYTSFLAPVTCPGLWGAAQRSNEASAAPGAGGGGGGLLPDRAFVTRMPRALALAPPLPVFTFQHTAVAAAGGDDASRECMQGGTAEQQQQQQQQPHLSAHLDFSTDSQGDALPALLHGFAGYFTAELFGGIALSTVPSTHTPGMHSWFPLFLPLRAPVVVEAGAAIALSMWRCSEGAGSEGSTSSSSGRGGGGRVWYEWALRLPVAQGLQNGGGASWDMRL
jgi:protein arginine N-methyltransferase 5